MTASMASTNKPPALRRWFVARNSSTNSVTMTRQMSSAAVVRSAGTPAGDSRARIGVTGPGRHSRLPPAAEGARSWPHLKPARICCRAGANQKVFERSNMDIASAARLLILAAIWGGSFVFMRICVPVLGPTLLVEARLGFGALFLLAIGAVL